MLAEERQGRILALLRARGTVRTSELMALFGVSRETIRRDLLELEERGLARRIHGGAALQPAGLEPPFSVRATSNLDEKRAIAAACAELVREGDVVLLDVGTTCLEVARALRGRARITVMTNSVPAALELVHDPEIRVFLTGGQLRPGELSVSGTLARAAVAHHYADRAILGAGGLTVHEGLTDYHVEEAELRRLMIEHARQVIVVADHSKFGVVAFTRIAPLDDIDVVVTDDGLSEEVVRQFREAGVDVVVARVARESRP